MRQSWDSEELIGSWTLVGEDWRLVGNKTGATRLGFALVLKFFEIEARFPAYPEEIPAQAVDYVATQVQVGPSEFAKYSFTSRTMEYHRRQIRTAWGFRPATEAALRYVRQQFITRETSARRWASWSTRPSKPAIRSGGDRAPPVPAIRRSSVRGSRT